jgi:hypothetical protein
MIVALRTSTTALAALLLLAACSSSPSSEGSQAASSQASAAAASDVAASTPAVAAGEPCSFLTAEEVGAIVGTTPVEVAERVGRGDCDYWLNAAKDAHVNIGVFTGPDNASLFEITRGIGDPQPVDNLGDDAYSIFNESIGTVVVVKQGDATIIVQVAAPLTLPYQLALATELAEAVLANL